MRFNFLGALVAASLCAAQASAAPVGTFIPAAGASDMVYDAQTDIIYISAGAQVLRYQVKAARFLSPIRAGGSLRGIDLLPDGRSVAVADEGSGSDHYDLIDTKTLAVQKIVDPDRGPTSGIAYLSNGDLLVAGYSVQRRSAATGQWTAVVDGSIGWTDVLAPSGDGSRVGIEFSAFSPTYWNLYDAASGSMVGFNSSTYPEFEIAVNSDGSQVAVPTYGGVFVYDSKKYLTTLGRAAVGGAYDPVRAVAYFPWMDSSEVRIFDMKALKQTGALDVGTTFDWVGNAAYDNGRTRLSRDGSLLMVTVHGGLQIVRLYAPLVAANASASVTAGSPVSIPVSATLGVPASFTFGVSKKPAHGTAKVVGNTVVYTPDYTFSGTETFTYQAHYSQAVANGKISVEVAPFINHPPVAVDDTLLLNQAPAPVLLDVLANDSDPDGQVLSIISATQPKQGKVAIQGNKILFTPASASARNAGFSYTISDGTGGTATANVHVAFVATGN